MLDVTKGIILIISKEHFELQQKYREEVLKRLQHDEIVKSKDEMIRHQNGQITTLRNVIEQMKEMMEGMRAEIKEMADQLKENAKELQKKSVLEHQYEQLNRLLYGRSSEKSSSSILPEQLLLSIEAEKVEACNINDGQKISSYTKHKPQTKKHPGEKGDTISYRA